MTLADLACECAWKLGAVPAKDPPARALFARGSIWYGPQEIGIIFDHVGAFFVSSVAGQLVVEAVALNNGEPRDIVLARHDELERLSTQLFGDNIERHDPLGLRGGPKAVAS